MKVTHNKWCFSLILLPFMFSVLFQRVFILIKGVSTQIRKSDKKDLHSTYCLLPRLSCHLSGIFLAPELQIMVLWCFRLLWELNWTVLQMIKIIHFVSMRWNTAKASLLLDCISMSSCWVNLYPVLSCWCQWVTLILQLKYNRNVLMHWTPYLDLLLQIKLTKWKKDKFYISYTESIWFIFTMTSDKIR